MRRLNYAVDGKHHDPVAEVKEFLEQKKLVD